jgi:hypothetical protein
MSTKRVSGGVVNRRSVFPEGHFQGDITEIKDDENPNGTIGSVAFQLRNNTAIDAEREPGQRPHFMRIPVWMVTKSARGKEETLVTAEVDPEDEDVPFMLRNAVGQFAQLAACLGRATVLPDGGVEFEEDLEAFIEEFRDGESFDGMTVEFIVSHRAEKKDGKLVKGGRTFVDTVFVIPEEGEPTPEEETEEEEEETVEEVEEEETEETEDEEEEEEEKPAPKKKASGKTSARSLVKGAKTRQATTKPNGAKKGSWRSKFSRKKK